MKPLNRKNYGSIPHLSNSKLGSGDYFITEGQERILTVKKRDRHDTIIVTEKYDGSNVGIANVNGQIVALTRSGYEARTSPYKQHHMFADWVDECKLGLEEMIGEGERVCGEWMAQAHGLKYRIDGSPIVFFDYFNHDNQRITQQELTWKLDKLSVGFRFKVAREIYRGDAIEPKYILPFLNMGTPEIKSDGDPEGMVYRVERKGKVDFLAKWVRSDFPTGQYIIGVDEKALVWNKVKN